MAAAQYEPINLSIEDLDRIKLPSFQRKFVWNKQRKNAFVTTLSNGLPFGSVLVYPESEIPGSKLLVLDGQQRLSTINEYQNHKLRFWKPLNQEEFDALLAKINANLPEEKQLTEKMFDELFDDPDEKLELFILKIKSEDARLAVNTMIKDLKKRLDEFVDLKGLKIPAIKFIGDKSLIADVFANLNQGGMPLSKYEIFSAAWVDTKIHLDHSPLQSEILDNVKRYYADMMRDTEFDLEGFSEDELTQNRIITLSELGSALGMYVRDHLKSLVVQTEKAANEIGFGILGIATGTDNRQLATLNRHVDAINANLPTIMERVERICTNLEDKFSKLLKRYKAEKSDEFAPGISTTFKTLSYFAALWDLDPKGPDYITSLRNIDAYYVYDFLIKAWTSHGDQRLFDFYPNIARRSYIEPISRDAFVEAYGRWLDDTTPGINFMKETVALVTIHANLTYLATQVPYGMDFELEHIVARKIITANDGPGRYNVFGNSIGNCMYLPKDENNRKKEKNLYQINGDGKYDELMKASDYFSEGDISEIVAALEAKDFERANERIIARARRVGEALADVLVS